MGDPIVIEAPELQSAPQRIVGVYLTFMVWAGWTYLWLPVVHFGQWLLDIKGDYQDFVMRGYDALGQSLPMYALVVALMGGGLLLWATYNFRRFRGRDRRRSRPALPRRRIAVFYGLTEAQVAAYQDARCLVMRHDESGRLVAVETR